MANDLFPWQVVSGFGSHIRATTTTLTIQYRGTIREYPLSSVRHLLIVGGHSVHTSVINHLMREGACVSFFDADGTPMGTLRPFGFREDTAIRMLQQDVPVHSAAVELVKASLRSRLIMVQKTEELLEMPLFYEGEQDFLHSACDEVEFLIKMDELRRIHRLTSDMYYEIMARSVPRDLGFKRRTGRPHRDPVNTMLSLGYALLFGTTLVSLVGAHLDPDIGVLRQGERSLVIDLIDPLKAVMVDRVVFARAREGIPSESFECADTRCHLADRITKDLVRRLRETINKQMIDTNILRYLRFIGKKEDFYITY
ncbi:MAG: CRISPR-associated endonuclease Cas1 [Methanomicrobiaceae archaeon]|nr:CRISPR-associated endonuclease Cas1 [Methanomicrobiaceae archaeon]